MSCGLYLFFSSRRRHTRLTCDWSSDVCSSDLVLGLVNRVGVAEAAEVLLGGVQGKAQAGRVDPAVADLAQPPCSRRLRQGICDLSQALRIRDSSKAVVLLGESDPGGLRGAGDVHAR